LQFKVDANNQAGRDDGANEDNADAEEQTENSPAPIDLEKFQELVKRSVFHHSKTLILAAVLSD
jgi:hypothetical protein